MSGADGILPLCPICAKEQPFCEHSDEERNAHVAALQAGDDVPFNSADEGQVDKASKSKRAIDKAQKKAFEYVMNSPDGRRFIWSMLARTGIYQSSFAKAQGDAARMAFFEGERNIGLELIQRAATQTPAHYALMLKENGHV